MMNEEKPLAKREDLVVQELPDELLIYDISTGRAFCLNETSAFVWRKADGQKSVAEIRRLMEFEYKSPVDEDLIWLALDQLGKDNLLENKPENKFANISRREVIRRVGVGSLITLPIIASLTTNVYAVTCPSTQPVANCQNCPNGTSCTDGTDMGVCISNGCCIGKNCTF